MFFQQRLRACIKKGNMTVADLHHWFARPRATVRYWLLSKEAARYEPFDDPKGRDAWHRLKLLELGVLEADDWGFPVPLTLSAHARPAYIVKVYNALDRNISKRDIAAAGLKGRIYSPQGSRNQKNPHQAT